MLSLSLSFTQNLQEVSKRLQQVLYSTSKQQAFLEDMAALIDDGATPKQACEIIAETGDKQHRPIADAILQSISRGRPMAVGLDGWFPPHIIELVRSGEEGGSLVSVMRSASESLTKRGTAMTALLGSLTYPLIVLVASAVVTVFINHSVFDSFRDIKPLEQWPENGQILVHAAVFLESYWVIMLSIFVAVGYGLMWMLRSYIGEYRTYIDSMPMLSMYRRSSAARFMETLGLLISNGMPFKQALKVITYNAKPYMSSHLLLMERRLSMGKDNIADVIDTGLLDKNDLFRLRVIAKGKGFEQALVRQGRHAQEKDLKNLSSLGKILGNVCLVMGGLYAGFLITTIYGIGSAMSGV